MKCQSCSLSKNVDSSLGGSNDKLDCQAPHSDLQSQKCKAVSAGVRGVADHAKWHGTEKLAKNASRPLQLPRDSCVTHSPSILKKFPVLLGGKIGFFYLSGVGYGGGGVVDSAFFH